ncbi:hypothetical protein FKP32DRAFT_1670655 [Trametes sanguinea]|nr:hypothetical protein FKP32DRAFT_1670655 [Trametes sanguinea]
MNAVLPEVVALQSKAVLYTGMALIGFVRRRMGSQYFDCHILRVVGASSL